MNYFYDVNPGYNVQDLRKGVSRNDADAHSLYLYDHLWKVFFFDRAKNKEYDIKEVRLIGQQSHRSDQAYYTLFVNKEEHLLSSDYIGPSTYWCIDEETNVLDIVKESRVLGGHILWPRGFQNTINQARGGSIGFYDRIDCTLSLLKQYYKLISEKKAYSEQEYFYLCKDELYANNDYFDQDKKRISRLFVAFENSKTWLIKFKTFNNFCDFFYLKDSFVDSDYDVVNFDDSAFPVTRPAKTFRENNIKAIQKRNVILINILDQYKIS